MDTGIKVQFQLFLRFLKLEKWEWPGPLNLHVSLWQGSSCPNTLLTYKLQVKAPKCNLPQFSLHNDICLMIEKEILSFFSLKKKKMSIRDKEEQVTSWVMEGWISWSNRIILHSYCTLWFLRYFWMNLNNLKITWGVEHITLILKIRKILKEVKRLT